MQKSLELIEAYLTKAEMPYVLDRYTILFEYEFQGTDFLIEATSDDSRVMDFYITWDIRVPKKMMDDVWSLMQDMYGQGSNFGELFHDSSTGQLSVGIVSEARIHNWKSEWIPLLVQGVLTPFMQLVDRALQFVTGVTPRQKAIQSYAAWHRKWHAEGQDLDEPDELNEPDDTPFWE